MASSLILLLLGATLTAAQCPKVHVFGARETTVSPGYGTAGAVVTAVQNAYAGTTAEAIVYPACGGQASCGSVSYANSAQQGYAAVAKQVNAFNTQCPSTVLVLIGYSQGGQIMDDAYCGGGDSNEGIPDSGIPISTAAQAKIAAVIFMGDPRHIPGLSYNVGTCTASGFAPRPNGFQCKYAANIQSYCDAPDPYCCNGSDANAHQQYANKYGSVALTFIRGKVDALLAGGGSTTTGGSGTTSPTSAPTSGTVPQYGQCGGMTWTGPTVCVSPFTCKAANAYYSQCL